MKKILLVFAIAIMFMTLVAAQSNLGVFKQNSCITLKQTCSNCTFVNITSVTMPDSTQGLGKVAMTKIGTEYNYTYCGTSKQGSYIYNTFGNPDGISSIESISFEVTPSGSNNLLGFSILVIVLIYTIGFFGFFGKHPWVSALGGMAMVSLGLYTINNGIDIYRTFITDVLSWTTIGIGALFILVPLIEFIQENL
jgi:hypothetical protein